MKRTIAMLDTISNRIIVVFFLLFFALFALAYYMEVDDALELISIPFTLAGVGVVYFVVSKKKKTEGNIGCEYKTKAYLILRESQCEKLKNHSTITILTGESGSGKSVLIRQLYEAVNNVENREAVIVINDAYYRNISLETFRKYEYVIFDQFENALKWDNIHQQFEEIIKLKNCGVRVIIVVRKEYLGDVYRLLNGKTRIVYLTNEDIKDEQVVCLLQEMVQQSDKSVRKEGFTAQIIRDFEIGDLTFIQLHALAALLSDDGFELVDGEHDYNQVIKRFIRYEMDKIYDSDAAREILYLLTLGYYGKEQHFSLKDFQNITFMKLDSLERIVEWLVLNEWICESDKTLYKDKKASRRFVISHDYYRDLLWEICIEDIDPEVRSNIDQYIFALRNILIWAGFLNSLHQFCIGYGVVLNPIIIIERENIIMNYRVVQLLDINS